MSDEKLIEEETEAYCHFFDEQQGKMSDNPESHRIIIAAHLGALLGCCALAGIPKEYVLDRVGKFPFDDFRAKAEALVPH